MFGNLALDFHHIPKDRCDIFIPQKKETAHLFCDCKGTLFHPLIKNLISDKKTTYHQTSLNKRIQSPTSPIRCCNNRKLS